MWWWYFAEDPLPLFNVKGKQRISFVVEYTGKLYYPDGLLYEEAVSYGSYYDGRDFLCRAFHAVKDSYLSPSDYQGRKSRCHFTLDMVILERCDLSSESADYRSSTVDTVDCGSFSCTTVRPVSPDGTKGASWGPFTNFYCIVFFGAHAVQFLFQKQSVIISSPITSILGNQFGNIPWFARNQNGCSLGEQCKLGGPK